MIVPSFIPRIRSFVKIHCALSCWCSPHISWLSLFPNTSLALKSFLTTSQSAPYLHNRRQGPLPSIVQRLHMAPDSGEDTSEAPRRSSRLRTEKAGAQVEKTEEETDKNPGKELEGDSAGTPRPKSKTVKKSSSPKKAAAEVQTEDPTEETAVKESPRKRRRRADSAVDEDSAETSNDPPAPSNSKPKKKKAPTHQVLTEKDDIPKLWYPSKAPEGSSTMKVASWNVAGLRALLKKMPSVLTDLVQNHDLDVLFLQETKLQDQHLSDPKLTIPTLESEGYQPYFSCSSEKKGYSGTAVYVRQKLVKREGGSNGKQPTIDQFFGSKIKETSGLSSSECSLPVLENVSYKMGVEKHDSEGRFVVLDFSAFTLVNVYVPNSGQTLGRLEYRTEEWDKDFLAFMQKKKKDRGVPVLWAGDLNVAHTNLEVWNDGAKHLPKQAGVTKEERESFQAQLDSGFIDAFRHLHPSAAGHYSYWSTRAGNREPNKGLRLDYFICDPLFFDESSPVVARDSYMLHDLLGSDHCPVVLELEVKGNNTFTS